MPWSRCAAAASERRPGWPRRRRRIGGQVGHALYTRGVAARLGRGHAGAFARAIHLVVVDATRACRPSNPGGFTGTTSSPGSRVRCFAAGPPTRPPTRTRLCWRSGSAARGLQPSGPAARPDRHRPRRPHDRARAASPSRPAGRRELVDPATVPGPPPERAHRQPARHGHPRHQSRPERRVGGLRQPRARPCGIHHGCCAAPGWSTWSTRWSPGSSRSRSAWTPRGDDLSHRPGRSRPPAGPTAANEGSTT